MKNIFRFNSAKVLREWLSKNYNKEEVCYLLLKHGKPKNDGHLYYLDAVEVVLCYGWIDSVRIKVNGEVFHRFTPRRKGGLWTELNKERVRRLEKLGLMTDAGRSVLPDMEIQPIIIPDDVVKELKKENALQNFNQFPELYKRIRIYNLNFYKTKLPKQYDKALKNFLKYTKQNKMYGMWNDYGRLLNY